MSRANSLRNIDAPPVPDAFYRPGTRRGSPHDLVFLPLVEGRFLARPNRFLIQARLKNGRTVRAASADPGRLRELLLPGAKLLMRPSGNPLRRTSFTVVLVRHRRLWVCLVPSLANALFEAAQRRGAIPGYSRHRIVGREVTLGASRMDFLLTGSGRKTFVEVKSATLVVSGRALFPDAPTARGRRHLEELARRARRGSRSLAVFVVQRSDARRFAPFVEKDPEFARALYEAKRCGVRILAFNCAVGPKGCSVTRRIPVAIPRPVSGKGAARPAAGRRRP